MNTEVKKYEVVSAGSVAQGGSFLDVGEVIEMEERLAHTEFWGRLKEVGAEKPTERWEESMAAQDETERLLAQKTLRAHERVQILEHREKALREQHAKVVEDLKEARATAESDQKKATARLAPKAAPAKPAPVEVKGA
jgi:hypothetical protein